MNSRETEKVKQVINSPVFTINIVDNEESIAGVLTQPISIDLKQLEMENRTSPQCVFWKYDAR